MKKYSHFFLSLLVLIIGVVTIPKIVSATTTNETVEVLIYTKLKGGEKVQGTDHLNFTIYDLTNWRHSKKMSEKAAKEFLLDKNRTTHETQTFVRNQGLKAVNQEALISTDEGEINVQLPRYQDSKDAAYLFVANGETGNYHFLPIVLFLPQYDVNSVDEATKIDIYGKYAEQDKMPVESSTMDESVSTTTPKKAIALGEPSSKAFPQTNDSSKSYLMVGGLLFMLACIGLGKLQKTGGKEDEKQD